jgi:hypothetical protein
MTKKLPLLFASAHVLLGGVLLCLLLRDPGASIWVVMVMMSMDFPVAPVILWVAHPLLVWARPDASGWIAFGFLAGLGTAWYYCLGWGIRWGIQRYRARRAPRSMG